MVVMASVVIGGCSSTAGTPASKPRSLPLQITTTLAHLTSGNPAIVKAALLPAVAAKLGHLDVFPRGSRLTGHASTWHQSGHYANVHALLTSSGKTTIYEVGFVEVGSTWKIIFAEPSQ